MQKEGKPCTGISFRVGVEHIRRTGQRRHQWLPFTNLFPTHAPTTTHPWPRRHNVDGVTHEVNDGHVNVVVFSCVTALVAW